MTPRISSSMAHQIKPPAARRVSPARGLPVGSKSSCSAVAARKICKIKIRSAKLPCGSSGVPTPLTTCTVVMSATTNVLVAAPMMPKRTVATSTAGTTTKISDLWKDAKPAAIRTSARTAKASKIRFSTCTARHRSGVSVASGPGLTVSVWVPLVIPVALAVRVAVPAFVSS